MGLSEYPASRPIGQNQRGVDIFGLPRGGSGYRSIQCKLKTASGGWSALTGAELEYEVLEAKSFRPPLEHLIVATTTAADARIQAAVREISDRNAAAGLFRVDVLAWPEILARLFKHDDLLNRYYPRSGRKLPPLGEDDVRAVRNFLPSRLLGRTAALLSTLLGLLLVAAIKLVLDPLNLGIPPWTDGALIGLCLLAPIV